MTNPPPPRLHVILATQAPVGIVIRRGPSKQFCTLLWNRKTDTFTMGQWLKGRIYEHRSDLSPDGKHFLYEAKNHFVFEKPFGRNWMLRSLVNQEAPEKAGKSSTWSEYSLLHFPTQTVLRFPDWEWADIDRSRRLVWASKGQIWAGQLNDNGLRDEKMLHDFNDMRFEAIKAPYD